MLMADYPLPTKNSKLKTKNSLTRFFTLIFTLFASVIIAQELDSTQFPVERVVDFETLDLILDINPKKKRVAGVAQYSFRALRPRVDSLFVHARDMEVERVTINDVEVRFDLDDEGLSIFPNPPVKGENKMIIEYVAEPTKGLGAQPTPAPIAPGPRSARHLCGVNPTTAAAALRGSARFRARGCW